jgi:nucleoid DNA-binding protein
MNKSEIVKAITLNERDVNGERYKKDDVQNIVTSVFELMKMALRQGDEVLIRGFGKFEVRHRNSKVMIENLHSGKKITTRECDYVYFKQATNMDANSLI